MKTASIAYVPPPAFGCAQEFWDNLQSNPAKGELILFSDHDWPGVVKLPTPLEQWKNASYPSGQDAGKRNPFAINNLLYLTAIRIARERGISHMFYLESDCRVAPGWDARVWEEYFSLGRPTIAAGTLATYNPCNFSAEAARRWARLVARNIRRNVPIATYGWLPAAQVSPSCVFPNGALAVYDLAWMQQLWNLDESVLTAVSNSAFDMVLGTLVWQRFAEDSYEVFGYLESVFSGYGDILTTEAERLAMLRDGRVCGVHQVKSKVNP